MARSGGGGGGGGGRKDDSMNALSMTVNYMLYTCQECVGCVAQSVARRTSVCERSRDRNLEAFEKKNFFYCLANAYFYSLEKNKNKKNQYDVPLSFS